MLGLAEVTSEVFQTEGWQDLFYGWSEKATSTGWMILGAMHP